MKLSRAIKFAVTMAEAQFMQSPTDVPSDIAERNAANEAARFCGVPAADVLAAWRRENAEKAAAKAGEVASELARLSAEADARNARLSAADTEEKKRAARLEIIRAAGKRLYQLGSVSGSEFRTECLGGFEPRQVVDGNGVVVAKLVSVANSDADLDKFSAWGIAPEPAFYWEATEAGLAAIANA